MKKSYCFTLDEDEHDKAENNIKELGGKMSTLINSLLKKFNDTWKKKN